MVLAVQAWLAQAIPRRPGAFLAANVVLAAVAGVLAAGAADRLAVDGGLERGAGAREGELLLTLTPRGTLRGQVARDALDVIQSGLTADPAVTAVGARRSGRDQTVLDVTVSAPDAAALQRASERVEARVDPGPFRLEAAGAATVVADARDLAEDDLPRLALLALPLALVVIGLAFGLRLTAAPILAAATAALGGIAVLRVAPASLDLTAAGIAVAAAVGLALAVEGCLAVRAAHGRADGALSPIASAGAATALAAAALLALPLPAAVSAALGGIAAALLVAVAAPVATGTLLALAPAREPDPALAPDEAPDAPGRAIAGRLRSSRLALLATQIALRPGLAWIPALAALAALGAATYPAFDAEPAALAPAPPGVLAEAGELLRSRLGWILGAIAAAGLVGGYLATRSVGAAIARGAGSPAAAGAACGLLALAADGSPDLGGLAEPAYASTFLVALAALGAIGAGRGALGSRRAPVAGTLVVVAGFGALAWAELEPLAQLGAVVATGALVDLLVVRWVLVPCLERALVKGMPRLRRPTLPAAVPRPRLPDRFRR